MENYCFASVITYDLVSRGADVENKNQCWGDMIENDTIKKGWGPGYQYDCIHSGSNEYSGGNTTWYNYVLATAGTIYDENATESNPAINTTKATESICPKGWTLPTRTQIQTIGNGTATYIPSFSSVLGGSYYKGALHFKDIYGFWWGSESATGDRFAWRNSLRYISNISATNPYTMSTNIFTRDRGQYIRCIQAS